MVHEVQMGTRKRMSFSRINEVLDMPDLIEVQKNSYKRFVEEDLREVLDDISPITDFTDSIVVKMFLRNEQVPEVTEYVKKGAFLKFRGVTTVDRFDSELTIASIAGIKKIANLTTARVDTSPQKRVELHCHTKMSDMDGLTAAKSLVNRA